MGLGPSLVKVDGWWVHQGVPEGDSNLAEALARHRNERLEDTADRGKAPHSARCWGSLVAKTSHHARAMGIYAAVAGPEVLTSCDQTVSPE